MDKTQTIQQKLIRFQKETKLSWERIANMGGITTTTIYAWLRGRGPQMAKWNMVEGAMRVYMKSRREEKQNAKTKG